VSTGVLGALLLCVACESFPVALPMPSPSPISSSTPSESQNVRDINDLAGCWLDILNPSAQRKQIYTVTGPDTLDLTLDVAGSQRQSKVQLKADGFLVVLDQDDLGETLQWIGEQLVFKINGAKVAVFERC